MSTTITVAAMVHGPVEKVWEYWTRPEHIIHWNNASADWCTPSARLDLRPGGSFVYRMESTDGSMGFDFEGRFDEVREHQSITYTIADGRKVTVVFESQDGSTNVVENFEAENIHEAELQRQGWQAILDHFKRYTEGKL